VRASGSASGSYALSRAWRRERRAGQVCSDLRCARRRCWIEEAHVNELTGLLREGPAGDQLDGWPEKMRIFARRERPHPGAQLTLFEAEDGWRYTLWVTNRPSSTKGWQGQLAYIDAVHRVHARVEDAIRTGKDCGIGKFPSTSLAMNKAWQAAALTAATLLAWLKLLALDGNLAKAEPKTLRYHILHAAARLTRGSRRRRLHIQASWPWAADIVTAWDRISALPQPPDQHQAVPAIKEGTPGACGPPGHPAPSAGLPAHPDPKIKIHYKVQQMPPATDRSA
jgi:hypothetical protein